MVYVDIKRKFDRILTIIYLTSYGLWGFVAVFDIGLSLTCVIEDSVSLSMDFFQAFFLSCLEYPKEVFWAVLLFLI